MISKFSLLPGKQRILQFRPERFCLIAREKRCIGISFSEIDKEVKKQFQI